MNTTTLNINPPTAAPPSASYAHALRNHQANLPAFQSTQPALAASINNLPLTCQWLYARDGSLTALDESNHWLSGCSLPQRAARETLRKLKSTGTACFLAPSHAAEIEIALSMMPPEHALLVILPNLADLAIALHCRDFSADLAAHRLWFAAGHDWPEHLSSILTTHPGLPTPTQFIRTPTLKDDHAQTLIHTAQRIFSQITQLRSRLRTDLRTTPRQTTGRPLFVAPTRFRLWDDNGSALLSAIGDSALPFDHLNPDDPLSSGNLALALAAHDASAVITINCTRHDLPDLIPDDVPVITWLTTPRIPQCSSPKDALLLADPSWLPKAQSAAWPVQRLAIAAPPLQPNPGTRNPQVKPGTRPHLAILADTSNTSLPPEPLDLSSHQLLWDLIRDDILRDPFQLADIQSYLSDRMHKLDIQPDGFDHRLFIERLILPTWQQSLARILLESALPLRLHGHGWSDLPDFAPHSAGPITSRDDLHHAASASVGLVHPFPSSHAHPIDSLGSPVLRPFGQNKSAFLNTARRILAGQSTWQSPAHPLSADLIGKMLP